MQTWIARRIETASWRKWLAWLAAMIGYSIWAFVRPGPWTRLTEATGEGTGVPKIPELMFGFPEGQPAATFELLGPLARDYAVFQVIDILYVALALAMTISGIAIGLKRFRLSASLLRYILLVPLVYLVAEIVENGLLFAMATGSLTASGWAATLQQSATSVKFVADSVNTLALGASILLSLGAGVMSRLRGGKEKQS